MVTDLSGRVERRRNLAGFKVVIRLSALADSGSYGLILKFGYGRPYSLTSPNASRASTGSVIGASYGSVFLQF